jgi:hypothetical protein
VYLFVTGALYDQPTCDDSAQAYARHLGGEPRDWMDQARHFEVGFDGNDPKEESVPRRDPYYRLGCVYRERFA